MRASRLVVSLIAVLSALAFVGCGSGEDQGALKGMTRQPPMEVGNVSLPNVNPDSSNRNGVLRGSGDGLMLVYFGYTDCPDVCPTTLADLRLAMEDLDQKDRSRLQVGMVTVDPKRDTARVLNGYLGHFFPVSAVSSFRTTDAKRLERVEKLFGASHRIGKADREGRYDVDHSAITYAVDSDGVVQVEWPFGTSPDDINSDLDRILAEQSVGGRS
jgi:protein SCO1/2